MTDSSNASRTMLMDLNSLQWSDNMLADFGIKKECLARIKLSSSDNFGTVTDVPSIAGVTIGGVIGDQQGACLGHLLKVGEVKNTYGTGCFILANVGTKPVKSTHGLLSTLCYSLGEGKTWYALEGAVEIAGAAIQWAKSVNLISSASELEELASTVDDCGDLYFVPAFNGLFSPYWRDDARGLMIGININTTRGHISRCLLESPCLRTREVVDSMQKDSEHPITRMSVDGGMTVNSLLLQVQANYSKLQIVRKREKEVTGIGAAIAAGLAVGYWGDIDEVESKIKVDRVFESQISDEARARKYKRWSQAVERSIGFGWEYNDQE